MSTLPNRYITEQEYLAFERESPTKHEYYRGDVFAMAGASESHNLIVLNIGAELRQQLKGRPCRALPSDMRVWVETTGLYCYPDVSVVCGESEFRDGLFDTLMNPKVVIEVVSDSSEAYDRGKKFDHYQQIISVDHILLVAQDHVHIQLYTRQSEDRWMLTQARRLDQSIDIPSIECSLSLAEVYDKVDLTRGGNS